MGGFFFESGSDDSYKPLTNTVGSFANANSPRSFDTIFQESCDEFKDMWKKDFKLAFVKNENLTNPAMVSSFKNALLGDLQKDCEQLVIHMEDGDAGSAPMAYQQVNDLFDNKVNDYIMESANVGDLMPIKTIDYPLLVKSHVKESFKDIIHEEVVSELVVKKRIEHTIVYDRKNPDKAWEYPQCLYDPEFQKILNCGRGLELKTEPVDLPLYQFNLAKELGDGIDGRRVVIDLSIEEVVAQDGTHVKLPAPMHVNLADNAWVGGVINVEYEASETSTGGTGGDTTSTTSSAGTVTTTGKKLLQDVVSGFTDWNTNVTTLTSANPANGVKSVIFKGRFSNERNENTLRTRYVQDDKEWKIGEGCKIDASYTYEELQEHKAIAKMDLYQRSYNDLVKLLSAFADRDGYDWLDEMWEKYNGTEFDALGWNPVVLSTEFDCDQTQKSLALQSEYIAKELKFKLDAFLTDIADTVKLEGLHFVMYGNPRYVRLLNPYVKWVFNAGQSLGGITLDYSYGVMTSGNAKIYVVSSKLVSAQKRHGLRIIPFYDGGFTFKRFKFSTDVVTSKESAYKDPDYTAGSQTYVWGTERYRNVELQAIQAGIDFINDDFITVDNRYVR